MSEPTWENIDPIPLSTIPGKPDVWGATRNGHIEELEARTLNLRGRAQSLEQRYLQGSGIPEGVVTASPGALYSDTAVTRGAALWRKNSGSGNTGWVVVSGDTGWRTITSWTSAGVVSGEPLASASWAPTAEAAGGISVKRTADQVIVQVRFVTRSNTTNLSIWDAYSLPVGFRPSAITPAFVPTDAAVTGLQLTTAGTLARLTGAMAGANGRIDLLILTAPALSVWPTTLPGTPA